MAKTRSQRLLPGLALLLALAGLFVLLRREEPRPEEPARVDASPSDRPREPEDLSQPSTPAMGEAPRNAVDFGAQRQDPMPSTGWARVLVTGRVEGAGAEQSRPVVIVRPELGELGHHGAATALAAWTYVEPDGTFRADVSHCFRREDETLLAALHVQLSSGSRLPMESVVAVPFTRAELERGGELSIPVDFELAALCQPELSVVLPAGESLEVTVVALTVRGERPGDELAVWSGRVEGRMRIELALPCNEPLFLVACAEGLRPRTLKLPARASLAVLELERGAVVAGRLRSGASAHVASFTAWPLGRGRARDLEVGPHALAWLQGQFEWPMAHARSGEDGTFELRGLVAGQPYELRWRDDLASLGDERACTVFAGEGDVQLDMDLRSVGVFLRTRAPESRQVEIELLAPGGARRLVQVAVPLDSPWWLQAEVGTRVRVFDRNGQALGETTVGEGARTTLEL